MVPSPFLAKGIYFFKIILQFIIETFIADLGHCTLMMQGPDNLIQNPLQKNLPIFMRIQNICIPSTYIVCTSIPPCLYLD